MEQLGKGNILFRFAGSVHLPEACAFHYHIAHNHLWVFNKIAVHRNAVFVRIKVYPIWLDVDYSVTLLQNENITCDLCACVCPKSIVGQTDSSQQLGSLGDIFPHLWTRFIHRTL